jgi:2,6-dihydroxypyridine 3-monooxygenase
VEFHDEGEQVKIVLSDGRSDHVDLLVFADGITSGARRKLLPEVESKYAGYVAWRGVIPEEELTASTYGALFDTLSYQVMPNSHILVYPIPGYDGEVEPGKRLMNIVWYRNASAEELEALLLDINGERRYVSVPPGLVNARAIDEMREAARAELAPQLCEVVENIPEPFIQVVYDINVPQMAFGRVCIIGDAAFAARPHAAAGTAKAAEDGWILAREVAAANGDVLQALAKWEPKQLRMGSDLIARTSEIGYRSQVANTFEPGDPSLIFGLYGPGN